MGHLFFDAALAFATSYLRKVHPGGMDNAVPVFVWDASIGRVTMLFPETSWYRNIEDEHIDTKFSPVSFVL
jgi:hypothetical protein